MSATNLIWVTIEKGSKQAPVWLRRAALGPDGIVYAAAGMVGNEDALLLAATWDGNVPTLGYQGHTYLPVPWLRRKYPDWADVFDLIEARVRQA